jgi:hypothetical protein
LFIEPESEPEALPAAEPLNVLLLLVLCDGLVDELNVLLLVEPIWLLLGEVAVALVPDCPAEPLPKVEPLVPALEVEAAPLVPVPAEPEEPEEPEV